MFVCHNIVTFTVNLYGVKRIKSKLYKVAYILKSIEFSGLVRLHALIFMMS